MESDSTKATIGTAAALSIKLPQFWAHSPKLWFAQAEAQFALRQVSSSLTKFYYAVAALPDHIASDVDDLLDPEPLNPYEALKAKLLRRFGETEDQRLQKLLHWSPPADQKPSQWLREMRRLLDNRGEQEGPLFRRLFLDRLPLNVQLLLKTSPLSDLDELAEKADELMALGDQPTVAAVDTRVSSDDLQILREQLSRLETTVNALRARPSSLRFSRRQSTSPRAERSRGQGRQRNDFCYYHRRFGTAARNCRPPCSFQGNE